MQNVVVPELCVMKLAFDFDIPLPGLRAELPLWVHYPGRLGTWLPTSLAQSAAAKTNIVVEFPSPQAKGFIESPPSL